MLRADPILAPPDDTIGRWIYDRVKGRTFADIGGIGVFAGNERTSIAARSGARACTMADIRPSSYYEWDLFRKISAKKGVSGIVELDNVDIRKRETLAPLGTCDLVHCTGILYHLPSPAEALWNLRSVTGEYLITNTVCIPLKISNEYGTLEVPESAVLFGAALTDHERLVLNKYYLDKLGFSLDTTSPRLGEANPDYPWVVDGELTCWPYWYYYTEHAFRSLLKLCKLEVVDEGWYENHTLFVLCRPVH